MSNVLFDLRQAEKMGYATKEDIEEANRLEAEAIEVGLDGCTLDENTLENKWLPIVFNLETDTINKIHDVANMANYLRRLVPDIAEEEQKENSRYSKEMLEEMKKRFNKLKRKAYSIEAYNSAKIEGAVISYSKFDDIYKCICNEDKRTEGIEKYNSLSEEEKQSFNMILFGLKADNLIQSGSWISEEHDHKKYLRELWEIMMGKQKSNDLAQFEMNYYNKDIEGTQWRTGNIVVTQYNEITHRPCNYEGLDEAMERLFNYEDMDKVCLDETNEKIEQLGEFERRILKSCVISFYLLNIHPFCDGCGRLTRLTQRRYLIDNVSYIFEYVKFSKQISNSKDAYYEALRKSEDTYYTDKVIDITPYIKYLLRVACDAIVEAVESINY